MRIVVAPNALKGSCSAVVAARAMAKGVRRAVPAATVAAVPVADGGDGLAEVVVHALGAVQVAVEVTGPRFAPVRAEVAWLPDRRTAFIEMALASGLALLPEGRRDATETTSKGTGDLMRAALDLGADTLVVGIGGSATNDGGVGMAAGLGYRFLNAAGRPVPPTGGHLSEIRRIDASAVDARLARARVEAICDVDNPLTGPHGASRVYGPQKGATPEQVDALDAGLEHLADLVARDLGRDMGGLPGSGAAGGLGGGLYAFCGAVLRPGADVVLDLVELDRHLGGADLVLTAEGRIDGQTRFGKAPAAVCAHASRLGVPCIALAGGLGEGVECLGEVGIDAVVSICPGPIELREAQERVVELLSDTSEQVVRIFLAGWQRDGGQRSPVCGT
jgi:glycerate kinase